MAEEMQGDWTAPSSSIPRLTFKDDKPFTFKPIIQDICKDICVPGSVMLVEKVERIRETLLNPSATRLILGDGELCIQAFLNPKLNLLVEIGDVSMGCYVRLDDFCVERADIEDSVNNTEESRKRKRREQIIFLKINQLATVGWDVAYMKYARQVIDSSTSDLDGGQEETRFRDEIDDLIDASQFTDTTPAASAKKPRSEGFEIKESKTGLESPGPSTLEALDTPTDQRVGELYPDLANREPDTGLENTSPPRTNTPDRSTVQIPEPDVLSDLSNKANITESPTQLHKVVNPILTTATEIKQIPLPSKNPPSLVPRTLASLSKLPTRQNSPCTVFAIIDEVAPLKPCPIPPHKTREVRLVDPSTTKRVLLSVLWQPETFEPKVGTPVLLRGLKNHKYDGGSLNAYPKSVSPFTGNEDGTDWWIPYPRGWEGCDVDGYLEWWRERQKSKG